MSLFTVEGTGNLTADPELNYTKNGVAVVNFTVATNRNKKNDSGEWETVASTFLRASAWRDTAEEIAQQFSKGDKVTVKGDLKQDSYEKDGTKITTYEIDLREISSPMKRSGQANSDRVQPNTGNMGGGFDDGDPVPF